MSKDKHITPKGIALYPYLNTPDTKFSKEGIYQLTLLLEKGDARELINSIDIWMEKSLEKARKERPGKRIKQAEPPYEIVYDPETEEETDKIQIKFKTKARVNMKDGTVWDKKLPLFDAKNKPLLKNIIVGRGSTVKVAFEPLPYYMPMNGAGVALRLLGVQVIALVQPGGISASKCGFEIEEEGFSVSCMGEGERHRQILKQSEGEDKSAGI